MKTNAAFRVFKNSSALSLSILIERGIAFILPWYVARVLGREAWGDYSTAYTFVLIGVTIAPWGLISLLPRQVGRDPREAPAALINGSIIGFGVGIATTVGMILLTRALNYPSQVETLIFVGLLTVLLPQTEATLFETVIQGLERMEWIVFVRLPGTIVRVGGSILLLSLGYGIEVLFYALAVYYLLNCLLYVYIFRRIFHFKYERLRLDFSAVWTLFIQAFPFFIIVSMSEVFKQIDRIFLSKLWDTDAVGIYATGVMFIQLLYMLAPALMGALFPGLSRTYIASQERFAYLVSWLFKLLMLLIFPVALATISFADRMILLVFGAEYEPSIAVMRLVALGILPSFLSRILYRATLASDNERLAVYVAMGGNSASLILNILLIPSLGVLGASLAALGTIVVNLGQNFWYVRRIIDLDYREALWRPGRCVLVATVAYGLGLMHSFILAFVVAMVIFLLMVWLTRAIDRRDLANLYLVRAES